MAKSIFRYFWTPNVLDIDRIDQFFLIVLLEILVSNRNFKVFKFWRKIWSQIELFCKVESLVKILLFDNRELARRWVELRRTLHYAPIG